MNHQFHPRSEWAVRNPGWSALGPTSLVFIHHTVSPYQSGFNVAQMRALEESEVARGGYVALAYHTIIPGDGCLVEARPAGVKGGATINHNSDSRAISFPGNYENDFLSDEQVDGAAEQIARWVKDGYCRTDFSVHPHREVFATACPGAHVMDRIGEIAPLAKQKLAGGGSAPQRKAHDMYLVHTTDTKREFMFHDLIAFEVSTPQARNFASSGMPHSDVNQDWVNSVAALQIDARKSMGH